MPALKCSSEVIEIKKLTYDVKELALKLIDPPKVDFTAGQYVSIEVTEIKEGHARLNNRPYSIASPPEENDVIKLCVNLVRGGPGSSYLHSLRLGDKVNFLYPMGYFTIHDEANTSLLFVATGTGIAPIKSMILHLLRAGSKRAMTLHWGLRKEEDLYYQEEFALLMEQYPFFKCITTLSQPSSEWQGPRGRVTHHLPQNVRDVENLEAYLCGNGEMIKEVRGILIEKGIARKAIHYEKFYN
jgi:CDP-4-dehydro-6-deoxyglucose reductase